MNNYPARWSAGRLKDVASATPSTVDKKSYDGQMAVRLCNYVDVYYNDKITADLPFMSATASTDEVNRFSVRAGEVVLTKDSESPTDIGIAAFVPETLPGVVYGYHLSVLRPNARSDGRFLKWLFDSQLVKHEFATRANGLTRVGLGQGALTSVPIPIPPVEEQRQIAAYLDRETGQIDALIAKQEQLLTTLAERRMASITEAVDATARNPTARTTRLKRVARIQPGITLGPDKQGVLLPYLRVANVQTGRVDLTEVKTIRATTSELRKHALQQGDVLMTEGGDVDKLGRGALWSGEIEPCLHQNHVFAVRCDERLDARWLVYILESAEARQYFLNTAKRSTNLASTNSTTVGMLPVTLLPLEQQRRTVAELDRMTSDLENLRDRTLQMIALLRERRQALISAAVTGKIDIRSA